MAAAGPIFEFEFVPVATAAPAALTARGYHALVFSEVIPQLKRQDVAGYLELG